MKKKILRYAASLLVIGALAAVGVLVMTRPPSFLRVREVVVMTPLKHLTEFDLIRLSEVKKGDNIVRLRLAKVRENLLRYPWIKEVRLSKRVPARLFVWVEEQDPVALLELPDATSASTSDSSWYFVNRRGEVFKKVEKDDPRDCPILTGLAPEEIPSRLPQMLSLLKSVEDSEFVSSLGVSEIHWGGREGLSLFTKEPCIKLQFGGLEGGEVWAERLKRVSEAWGMIRSTAKKPKAIDLSLERRIVVKQEL